MSKTLEYVQSFVPRGRWFLAKYIKAFGDTTSLKVHVYEVVDPGNVPDLTAGEQVIINPEYTVQVGESYAYCNFDRGAYAKWNSAYDEPVVLYAALHGEVVDWMPDSGVAWFGDALVLRVIDVDSAINDIAPNDEVIVPRRFSVHVGRKANTRFIVRAEDVLAVNPSLVGVI